MIHNIYFSSTARTQKVTTILAHEMVNYCDIDLSILKNDFDINL